MKKPDIMECFRFQTVAQLFHDAKGWYWVMRVDILGAATHIEERSQYFDIDYDCWNDLVSKYGKTSQELLWKLGDK